MKWYYAENGRQIGPLSEDEFNDLVRTGKVAPETLVWNPSMAGWEKFQAVGHQGETLVAIDRQVAPDRDLCPPADEDPPARPVRENCAAPPAASPARREQASPKPAPSGKVTLGRTVAYAGFWQRGAAKLVDLFLLGLAGAILTWAAGLTGAAFTSAAWYGLQLALAAVYTTFFLGRFNATPGKMLLKLYVMTATGDDLGYLRAFFRFGGEVVSGLALGWGFFRAAYDEESCALHDRLVQSRVVGE